MTGIIDDILSGIQRIDQVRGRVWLTPENHRRGHHRYSISQTSAHLVKRIAIIVIVCEDGTALQRVTDLERSLPGNDLIEHSCRLSGRAGRNATDRNFG